MFCRFFFLLVFLSTFAVAQGNKDNDEALYLYQTGQWDAALRKWSKIIKKDPNSEVAYFYIGKIHFSRGRIAEAMDRFWEILRMNPDHVGAHAWLGVSFLRRNFVEQGEKEVNKAKKINAEDWQTHWALGELALYRHRQFQKVISHFQTAIEHKADDPVIRLRQAAVYTAYKKRKEAIDSLKEAVRLGMDSSVTDPLLADLFYRMKDYDQSLFYYERSLDRNPHDFEIRLRLGMIYEEKGEYEKALQEYKQYLDQVPSDVATVNTVGLLLFKLLRPNEALEFFKKAVEVDPKNAWSYNNMAIVYRELGQMDEAILSHERAIQADPSNVAFYHSLGNSYFEAKDYLAAVVAFEKAIKINPSYQRSYRKLGLAHLSLGDFKEALNYLEKARSLDPANPALMDDLGIAFSRKGAFTQAIQWFQKAIEANSHKSLYHQHLADTYLKDGQVENAILEWGKASSLDVNDIRPYEALGDIHRDYLKQWDKAEEYYRKILGLEITEQDRKRIEWKIKQL